MKKPIPMFVIRSDDGLYFGGFSSPGEGVRKEKWGSKELAFKYNERLADNTMMGLFEPCKKEPV